FKIGISSNPRKRSALLPQAIDLPRSLQIPMSGGYANKVERLLHYLFRDRAMAMPYGDGHTEWFAMDAWNEVLAFLAGQRARLGVGEPKPIPLRVRRAALRLAPEWTPAEMAEIERAAAYNRG
ncbi:hypothetical protein GUH86_17835, partial [Xanthomonas citri pv. citri]|nr:hypothetical protein [Xanthomonas citri pv. citri]